MKKAIRITVGGLLGASILSYTGYNLYWERRKINALVLPSELHANQKTQIEELYKTMDAKGVQDLTSRNLVLFQFSTCPFSSKVRTFLDTHGIPYKKIEVDPFTKEQIKHLPYQKVPQLHFTYDNVALVDSREIVSIISPIVGEKIDDDITKWRKWADEVLARYIVLNLNAGLSSFPSNIYYISAMEELSASLKAKYIAAGGAMFLVSHLSTKKKLQNLGYDTTNVKESLHKEFRNWCQQNSDSKTIFHSRKSTPDIADTDIFGILSSIKGHTVYSELANEPSCSLWVKTMEQFVNTHKHSTVTTTTTTTTANEVGNTLNKK